jgi:hypothetical protein
MSEQMSKAEIEQYMRSANEDLVAAQDNLRLGHLRVAVSRAYYAMFARPLPYWVVGDCGGASTRGSLPPWVNTW